MIEIEELDQIVADRLISLDYCYQCALCSGVCPMSLGSDFRPRKFMIESQLDSEKAMSSDLLWSCSTCYACVDICPQGVKPPDVITSLRSHRVESGHIPQGVSDALTYMYKRNNPWGLPKDEREAWAEGLSLKKYERGMEWLWFVSCAASYDSRNQEVAKALAQIFEQADVDIGFLGNDERCCGDSARRLGEEGLFQVIAEENTMEWDEKGAGNILTTSPHCFHTFNNEYPQREGVAKHYSQLLAELVEAKKITFGGAGEELVITYHDPCYLGRHNGVFDEPRSVLSSIPGVEVTEMPRNRDQSFCCGGGGGRVWVETEERERPSEIRVKEAVATGAQAMITACPFCTIHFEEAVKTLELEEKLQIIDLAELVNKYMN